jgi:hypothetical protein
MKMPRKSFRGKSMRPDKGVVVNTETVVKYRKRTRPGKRMVFGSVRAQKAEREEVMVEKARALRQKSLDDYVLVQKRIEDFKRYPKKKRRFRTEKSLGKKKAEEAADIVEMVREEMERPGAVRIKEPWREESLPYRVKKKLKETFPIPAEKIGGIKAYHKADEMAAKAYDEVLKKKEEIKKKAAKKMVLVNMGTGNSPEMMKLVLFLIGVIIVLGLIAWLASIF